MSNIPHQDLLSYSVHLGSLHMIDDHIETNRYTHGYTLNWISKPLYILTATLSMSGLEKKGIPQLGE